MALYRTKREWPVAVNQYKDAWPVAVNQWLEIKWNDLLVTLNVLEAKWLRTNMIENCTPYDS